MRSLSLATTTVMSAVVVRVVRYDDEEAGKTEKIYKKEKSKE